MSTLLVAIFISVYMHLVIIISYFVIINIIMNTIVFVVIIIAIITTIIATIAIVIIIVIVVAVTNAITIIIICWIYFAQKLKVMIESLTEIVSLKDLSLVEYQKKLDVSYSQCEKLKRVLKRTNLVLEAQQVFYCRFNIYRCYPNHHC